jgi:hypothetical protein
VVPLSGVLRTLLVRTFDDDGLAEAWVTGSQDLAVEDGVPGIGVRGPATPFFGGSQR